MINIIFLDVDGVLNSLNCLIETYELNKRPYSGYDYPFDSKCLNNLVKIVNETEAYLVITSTWRMDELGKKILLSELKKYNLDNRVIGYTDVLHTKRGEEIREYLKKYENDVNFIIIDDDNDFEGLEKFLIKTSFKNGLTEEDADKGIKLLLKRKI